MSDSPIGVMVMAYGTPGSRDELEAYYTHIRRGRPPTAEQMAELRARYDAIGGLSPLRRITQQQVEAVAAELQRRRPDAFRVRVGLKHAAPLIEDATEALRDCREIVGLVLAPHFSHLSVGSYLDRLAAAAPWADVRRVASWWAHPGYVDALSARLTATLARTTAGHDTLVLFTAHSLPARIVESDDPYVEELTKAANLVASRSDVTNWALAWQSAGRTPEPWLGPDIRDVLRALAGEVAEIVVCPHGFTADHLEVLYDIDIEAAAVAAEAGITLLRTPSFNDDAALVGALADMVEAAAR